MTDIWDYVFCVQVGDEKCNLWFRVQCWYHCIMLHSLGIVGRRHILTAMISL